MARPDLVRLRLWKLLERPDAAGPESEAFLLKTAAVAGAQQRGELAPGMLPAYILTTVLAAAQACSLADEGGQPRPPERRAQHRAAVVEAARRIIGPRGADS